MSIDELMSRFVEWAREREDVVGAALAGSRARGEARPDSDVDLMIVTTSPDAYVSDPAWVEGFGAVDSVAIEDWGAVTSLRVRYAGGPEVEFGVTTPEWASVEPLDPGTATVVAGGWRILLDRDGALARLASRLDAQ